MAVWQKTFHLVPREAVKRLHGQKAAALPKNAKLRNYWVGRSPRSYAGEVETLLPARKSWSANALMFGDEEGDAIELWDHDLMVRLNIHERNEPLAQAVVKLAAANDLVLVVANTGRLIPPVYDRLDREIAKSLPLKLANQIGLPHPREGGSRGIGWWLLAILTPIGVIGGPLVIANVLADVIEWHGPWGAAIQYWDDSVGAAFSTLFGWLAQSLHLPAPPWWLTDYLSLAILFQFSILRASTLFPSPLPEIQSQWVDRAGQLFWRVRNALAEIVFWPAYLYAQTRWAVRLYWQTYPSARATLALSIVSRTSSQTVRADYLALRLLHIARARILLTLAPFILFLTLWLLNTLFGDASQS